MSREVVMKVSSGWTKLAQTLTVLLGSPIVFFVGLGLISTSNVVGSKAAVVVGILCVFLGIVGFPYGLVLSSGFFTLPPNVACILSLFGEYKGTVRDSGFFWTNPFMTKRQISLRSRSLEGAKLKVNDKQGNPIEIGIVVVWKVQDTAEAVFDVENYEQFVQIQSETAVRHLANSYAYDHGEEHEITLRSGVDEVSSALLMELQERLSRAGVHVEEARLTHLSYASEIAGVMLRRQQAEAVIAARQKIVHGAVSMVQMALNELAEKEIVHLDDDRKAAMVNNLLVILCGEGEARPVLNTGTLFN